MSEGEQQPHHSISFDYAQRSASLGMGLTWGPLDALSHGDHGE